MDYLNDDITTIESLTPFLKQCIGKGKEIPLGSLLQVQQITNISFPTYDKPFYDFDKHTLKVTVTDGHSQGYALVAEGCPGINLTTTPGTKIRTTQSIPVQGNLFILTRNNCEVLGGRVVKLIEKWEVQKKTAIKHEWGYTGTSIEGEGPPPWKPFGFKSTLDVAALRKMKTSDVVSERKDSKAGESKSQFDMQRDEAISELQQATANKQKFQKPNKHLLDKEITDIMEEGFSQNEAEYAMNKFKNTQKAIKFLKEANKRQYGPPKEFPPVNPPPERKDRRKGRGARQDDEDDEQEVPAEYQRPTRSISLFGFIEGQIKTDDKSSTKTGPPTSHGYRSRDLEEGMSNLNLNRSSTLGRRERGGRGGRGGSCRFGGRGPGGGDIKRANYTQDSYFNRAQLNQQSQSRYEPRRFDDKGAKGDFAQRPPRFQNRSGDDRNGGGSGGNSRTVFRGEDDKYRGGGDARSGGYTSSDDKNNYDDYKGAGEDTSGYRGSGDSRSGSYRSSDDRSGYRGGGDGRPGTNRMGEDKSSSGYKSSEDFRPGTNRMGDEHPRSAYKSSSDSRPGTNWMGEDKPFKGAGVSRPATNRMCEERTSTAYKGAGNSRPATNRMGDERTSTAYKGDSRPGTNRMGDEKTGSAYDSSGDSRPGTNRVGVERSSTAYKGSGDSRHGTNRMGEERSSAAAYKGDSRPGTNRMGEERSSTAYKGAGDFRPSTNRMAAEKFGSANKGAGDARPITNWSGEDKPGTAYKANDDARPATINWSGEEKPGSAYKGSRDNRLGSKGSCDSRTGDIRVSESRKGDDRSDDNKSGDKKSASARSADTDTWSSSENHSGKSSRREDSSITSSHGSRGQSRDGYDSGSSSSYFYPQDCDHPNRSQVQPAGENVHTVVQLQGGQYPHPPLHSPYSSDYSVTRFKCTMMHRAAQQYYADQQVPSGAYQSQYPPPQQQQTPRQQYMSNQGQHGIPERPSTAQRPPSAVSSSSSYSNHSSYVPPPPTANPEFSHYQYGYEDWNPGKSMVFTRSKPQTATGGSGNADDRGGRFHGSGGRGSSQSMSHTTSSSSHSRSNYNSHSARHWD